MMAKNGDIDWEGLERELFEAADVRLDRMRMEGIMREAERIARMILDEDMPRVDIEIAIRSFRKRVLEEFPDKEKLFEGLYVKRFNRLWEQFRGDGTSLQS